MGKRFFILIFMLAFLLRLAAVLSMRDIHKFHGNQLGADAREFDQLALSVASGNGYSFEGRPTAFRAPGFPLYMAGIYKIFGEHYPPQYIALCLMGALVCGLTYLAGRELGSEQFARVAGLLAVFYIPHVYTATIFASENLFCLCLVGGLLALLRAFRENVNCFCWISVAGACFGWGILTRPFLVLAMPFLFVLVIWQQRSVMPRAVVYAGALALTCLIVVLPWTIRNHRVFGKFVFVATNGGSTFYGAHNDIVLNEKREWGGWVPTTRLPGRDQIDAQPNEISHDAKEWELGRGWALTHWTSLPDMELFKMARFWLPDVGSENRKYVMVQLVTYTPFLLLFLIAGVRWILKPRWDPKWLAVDALMFSCILTALIFWGSPRFRDGNAPILMLYAATALPMIPPRWVGIKPAVVK